MPSQAKPLLITDTAHAGRKAPSVHHPRALVGCMLRSAQLARSHAPARCALVAAVLPVIQARRSCLCMPLRRAEAAAANFTSILIVPHALGLLATADEGKLASAAVLEKRGAHRQKSLCSSPGTPHAEPLGVSNSERTSKKEHVVLHDRQQVQKELSWSAGVLRTVYESTNPAMKVAKLRLSPFHWRGRRGRLLTEAARFNRTKSADHRLPNTPTPQTETRPIPTSTQTGTAR